MSRRIALLVLVGGLLAAAIAAAEPPMGYRPSSDRGPEQRRAAPAEIGPEVSGVRDRTGGRVLSAQTYGEEGEEVEVIRVLTPDGRVRRFQFDRATPPRGLMPR